MKTSTTAHNLTLACITAAMALFKKMEKPWIAAVLSTKSMRLITPPTMGGIDLYEKDQIADGWLFRNQEDLKQYLSGELTEMDLIGRAYCKPLEAQHDAEFFKTLANK